MDKNHSLQEVNAIVTKANARLPTNDEYKEFMEKNETYSKNWGEADEPFTSDGKKEGETKWVMYLQTENDKIISNNNAHPLGSAVCALNSNISTEINVCPSEATKSYNVNHLGFLIDENNIKKDKYKIEDTYNISSAVTKCGEKCIKDDKNFLNWVFTIVNIIVVVLQRLGTINQVFRMIKKIIIMEQIGKQKAL